jgi:hypothetical protein
MVEGGGDKKSEAAKSGLSMSTNPISESATPLIHEKNLPSKQKLEPRQFIKLK